MSDIKMGGNVIYTETICKQDTELCKTEGLNTCYKHRVRFMHQYIANKDNHTFVFGNQTRTKRDCFIVLGGAVCDFPKARQGKKPHLDLPKIVVNLDVSCHLFCS